MNLPKAVGTAAETAVVRALRQLGFPHAERRALTGAVDQGDVTGCPGLVFEVKGGNAARNASDAQVAAWLDETERERVNAGADVGVLVLQRAGKGPANAGQWWAVLTVRDVWRLHPWCGHGSPVGDVAASPIRMLLADACSLLRAGGYGTALDAEGAA